MKKIVFNAYPRFGLDLGGLQIQVLRTEGALRKLGHNVIYHNPWADLDSTANILHCFSIDASNLYLSLRAKKYGIRVVVSPVLNAFEVGRRLLKAKIAASRLPGIYTGYRVARALFDVSDVVVALNDQEAELLSDCFKINEDKISIIPNGVDERFFCSTPSEFETRYPDIRNMLLQVSSVEERKNQLNVVRAIRLLEEQGLADFSYVNIGPARDGSEAYIEKINEMRSRKIHLLPAVDNADSLLPSAYAAARAFILPSFSEVMPLVLYEAAAAGCRLLVSNHVPVEASVMDRVVRFKPDDPADIAEKIASLSLEERTGLPAPALQTWLGVAREIDRHCYE
ncbi:glycosyltransferase family 4 protein [Cupriavidus sp. TMH.W2]|uniref:glycosyltransferase family 4 protein n=1 Tax=Cupriavidus sp. TMH.W2 TaxID=3434465 RepID=UPI003D77FD96